MVAARSSNDTLVKLHRPKCSEATRAAAWWALWLGQLQFLKLQCANVHIGVSVESLLRFFFFDGLLFLIIGTCIYVNCSSAAWKGLWWLLFAASLYVVQCSG